MDNAQVLSMAKVQLKTNNRPRQGIANRVAVHRELSLAAAPGNPGEHGLSGAHGTSFFADPRAQRVVAFGTAAPGACTRTAVKQSQLLVDGALTRSPADPRAC